MHLRDGSAQTSLRAATLIKKPSDQTCYHTQSQYADTGPTSPSADPITPFRVATGAPISKSLIRFYPKSPHSESLIRFYPKSPHSESLIRFYPKSPHSESLIQFYPKSPHSESLIRFYPKSPHSESLIRFYPKSNHSESLIRFYPKSPHSESLIRFYPKSPHGASGNRTPDLPLWRRTTFATPAPLNEYRVLTLTPTPLNEYRVLTLTPAPLNEYRVSTPTPQCNMSNRMAARLTCMTKSLPRPGRRVTRGRYHGGRRPSSDDSLHSPTVIPPSALDKSSIVKRYHRR